MRVCVLTRQREAGHISLSCLKNKLISKHDNIYTCLYVYIYTEIYNLLWKCDCKG